MDFLMDNPLIILALILMLMVALIFVFSASKEKDSSKPSSAGGDKDDYISKQINANAKREKKKLRKHSKKVIEKMYGEGAEKQIETLKQTQEPADIEPMDYPEVSGEFKQPYKSAGDGLMQRPASIDATSSDDELMKNIEFVPTSSKVARLKRVSPAKLFDIESGDKLEEFEPLQIPEAPSTQPEPQKPKYFDRSQRLSKSIASGRFDDMFKPHISEKYMNMDASRHLRSDDEFSESLLDRTSRMLANSGTKTLSTFDSDLDSPSKSFRYDRDMMKEWVERRKREETARLMLDSHSDTLVPDAEDVDTEELKLSSRNLFLSDAISKRKSGKRSV